MTQLFLHFNSQDNGARHLSLAGHVGFDSLPDQLVNKSIFQGFCFNILCIGMLYSRLIVLHTTTYPEQQTNNDNNILVNLYLYRWVS